MKTFVKAVLRAGVTRLPWGARDAMLRALAEEYGESNLLTRMAREAGITGFIAGGTCGAIQSATTDHRILMDYARTGTWATPTVAAFERFFHGRGGTYLDIGANIGLTTIPVARNRAVRCVAFEPDPTNFANLTDNVRRNAGQGNVELHQVALFDRSGSVAFRRAAHGNLGDHRVVAADSGGADTIDVQSARLDDMLAKPEGPLAVKLDAQGAEPFIIAGGPDVLGRAELMVLEFSPMLIDQLGGDVALVIEFLAGFDTFEVVRGDSGEAPQKVHGSAMRKLLEGAFARGRENDLDYLDVYATRGARA